VDRARVALVVLWVVGCGGEIVGDQAEQPENSDPTVLPPHSNQVPPAPDPMPPPDPPPPPPPPPPPSPPVSNYVNNGTCSTSVVLGLSLQISEEMDCIAAGTLARLAEGGGISFAGSAVLPYLAPDAKRDLQAEANASINSLFRTVVQQYLLYEWYQQGRCGIAVAATPGNSNHETGRAADLGNWASVIGAMSNHGWSHDVPGDDVHFDHLASPDARGLDVHAFQRLWNRNHPDDHIDEDGIYGPMTAARIARSPSGGFPIGACGSQMVLSLENQDWLAGAVYRQNLPENAD
jgi:hypothetical protein